MNALTQADRDRLTTAYADALDRHLRYMAEQRDKQTITVQGTQPAKQEIQCRTQGKDSAVQSPRTALSLPGPSVSCCTDTRQPCFASQLGVEVQAVTQAESVICTLVLTGAHRCDISPILRNTRWAEWYQDSSQMHDDDEDGELIVSLPIASLQEAEEALRLTSGVKCSLGRHLCFVLRGEKIVYINLCDSGRGWQELSGSLY